jgi:small subunit ribosomal protein S9
MLPEKTIKKPKAEVKKPAKVKMADYFEAVGRRKTATARVRLLTTEKSISINGRSFESYFPISNFRDIIISPLKKMEATEKFGISAKVKGGGIHAQAEAIRHGIAQALTLYDSEARNSLKSTGYLTRDPRMRERKKFGLKRARRAPQWNKR